MRLSTFGRVAAITGIGLVAGATLLRFVIVPGQAVLPADTDTSRAYEGTINTLLNAEALASLDLRNLLIQDLPITITRDVQVIDVADGAALVEEQTVVAAPDGSPVLASEATYAVDRKTMESAPASTFADAEVTPTEGLVIGWPIGTEARDYEGWSGDLQSTVTAQFAGTEQHAGIETHVFQAQVSNAPIVDPALLSQLPATLPKDRIGTFAGLLGVDEATLAAFEPVLAGLPDEVPLGYVYSVDTTYWVDPTTGIVVDLNKEETRSVVLDVEGLSGVPVAAVYDVSYHGAPESVAATVLDAQDKGSQLRLFGTVLPIGMAALGLLLLLVGLVKGRRSDDIVGGPVGSSKRQRELIDAR